MWIYQNLCRMIFNHISIQCIYHKFIPKLGTFGQSSLILIFIGFCYAVYYMFTIIKYITHKKNLIYLLCFVINYSPCIIHWLKSYFWKVLFCWFWSFLPTFKFRNTFTIPLMFRQLSDSWRKTSMLGSFPIGLDNKHLFV